ncbi:hypothetical protein J2S40_003498 [Nocardioides luteus]|uniref:DUF4064 domain-containing protein n=1 Tax=Nocardioides luteus TaxID=1844 RepID=A0ABQ5SYE5_9ACTN|nr:hypothetical protein [Nocardioides luteus]MDR7312440.1 hypothetical protein [Nocardioides luteus]GLJ68688.1 hypothetical protein GCM10017579_27240 [Nocardioides luteus]
MSETKLPRPGQATLAGWLIVLGSLLTVVTAWDQIAGLRSLDTRERVEKVLAEPPLAGTGIDLNSILDIMHVMALVTGAMAAAAVILGWHVLKRSKQARLALTVIAAPLFFTGMFAGGFWSTMAAVAVVLLWMSPTRDWFDGVAPVEREASAASTTGTREVSTGSTTGEREVSTGSTTGPTEVSSGVRLSERQPPPWSGPVAQQTAAAPTRRPGAVMAAAALTWIGSGFTALMMLASAVTATANPDLILEQVRKQAESDPAMREVAQLYTTDVIVASAWVMAVLVTLVCIAAGVFAALALRRHSWARVALMISAGVSGLTLLLFALAFPPAVVLFGAAVATFSFLLRPEVNAWFRGRSEGSRA